MHAIRVLRHAFGYLLLVAAAIAADEVAALRSVTIQLKDTPGGLLIVEDYVKVAKVPLLVTNGSATAVTLTHVTGRAANGPLSPSVTLAAGATALVEVDAQVPRNSTTGWMRISFRGQSSGRNIICGGEIRIRRKSQFATQQAPVNVNVNSSQPFVVHFANWPEGVSLTEIRTPPGLKAKFVDKVVTFEVVPGSKPADLAGPVELVTNRGPARPHQLDQLINLRLLLGPIPVAP